jgi:hypothetical protein
MSGLTECASCGAAVPGGAYCAVCGQAFSTGDAERSDPAASESSAPTTSWAASATAGVTVMPPRPPLLPTSLPTQRERLDQFGHVVASPTPTWRARLEGGSNRYKAGVAVVLVLAAGFFVFGRGESHTITGDLTLVDTDVASLDVGDSCSGQNGYDDISSGAEVVVEDEAGTTLATSQLVTGSFDGVGCVFEFTVEDVGKATFYRVLIGRDSRGGLRYSHDELANQNWSVHLSLGD